MTQLEKGTPITDVKCGICHGVVTVVTGARPGDLLKGRCENKLANGKVCGSWFTVGTNPSYLLKQDFLKSDMEGPANDNGKEANDNQKNDQLSTAESDPEGDETNAGDRRAGEVTRDGTMAGDRGKLSRGNRRGFFRR